MTSYWVNFAASVNPNGGSLTKWPPYTAKDDQVLEFGDQIAVRSEINKAGLVSLTVNQRSSYWPMSSFQSWGFVRMNSSISRTHSALSTT
jgi:hypothetical protein